MEHNRRSVILAVLVVITAFAAATVTAAGSKTRAPLSAAELERATELYSVHIASSDEQTYAPASPSKAR
jgi:hypothetical protein